MEHLSTGDRFQLLSLGPIYLLPQVKQEGLSCAEQPTLTLVVKAMLPEPPPPTRNMNQMALMCPQTAPHRQLLFNSVPVIHEPFKSIFVYLNPLYVSDKVSSLNINPALYKTVFLFLFL